MKPITFFTLILLIIVGINASPDVLCQTIEIPLNYVTRDGANIILDIQHSFTDSEFKDQTVAIYFAFTSETGIEAAMFFLYHNYKASSYWMIGDPITNPLMWTEGIKDQHYYFDNSSTITVIFVEFLEIYDLNINLLTSAKLLPDFTYDSSYVDFPQLLTYFPIVLYPSGSTSTTVQTESTSAVSSTTDKSSGSTSTGITNGFSVIVLIGALFLSASYIRRKR